MNQSKKRLLYVQPLLPSYREFVVRALAKRYDLTVLCGTARGDSGFSSFKTDGFEIIDCPHVPLLGGRLTWQRRLLGELFRRDVDKILACANPRDLTYWALLVICAVKRTKVYSHGQGLYRKRRVSLMMRLVFRLILLFSEKYIAYTQYSRDSLLRIGLDGSRIAVADNAVDIQVGFPERIRSGKEMGVLFVGRLRAECGLELLIDAVRSLRNKCFDVELHVIGGGELEYYYREKYPYSWVIFHGAIYDNYDIETISNACRVGCYPGNAGLSIVHYFALRLPPVLHDDLPAHMGPEPSYVRHLENGILFESSRGVDGLVEALESVWSMPEAQYRKMSDAAFETYQLLASPPLGEKFVSIMDE